MRLAEWHRSRLTIIYLTGTSIDTITGGHKDIFQRMVVLVCWENHWYSTSHGMDLNNRSNNQELKSGNKDASNASDNCVSDKSAIQQRETQTQTKRHLKDLTVPEMQKCLCNLTLPDSFKKLSGLEMAHIFGYPLDQQLKVLETFGIQDPQYRLHLLSSLRKHFII